jgi:hypothetical protein
MSEHHPRIRLSGVFDTGSLPRIRESVGITFYMRRNHQEVAPAVLRALEVYRRAIAPHALGEYPDPLSECWQPLDDKGWAFINKEFEQLGTRLWLCESASTTTGYEFIYSGQLLDRPLDAQGRGEASTVAFFLPSEYLEEHGPVRVRELALELAQGLPFNSGHAGLTLLFPDTLFGATAAVREEALRYPGLDLADVNNSSYSIGTRVRGVHWMNFLGQPVLGELGGAANLRARLRSSSTTVQELEGERAVVTLGPWPESGDLEKGQTLPAYRELANVLAPWRYEERFRFHGFSDKDMRRWQRRFLD